MSTSPAINDPVDQDLIHAIEAGAFTRAFGIVGRENSIRATRLIASVKERKAYKQLGHTWESFCEVYLGRPRRSVEEDIANLDAFDEEALGMMQRLGVTRDAMRALRSGRGHEDAQIVVDGTAVVVGDRRHDLQDEASVSEAIQALVSELNRRANEAEDARAAADQVRSDAAEERTSAEKEIQELKEKLTQKKVGEQDRRKILSNQGEILLGLSELTGAYATLLERCRSEVPSREEVLPHLRSLGAIHGEILEWAMRRHRYATPAGVDPERLDELDRELARLEEGEIEPLAEEESNVTSVE